MGMTVQHNITAMNSNRMLGVTTGAQAKSTEKLSSGFKINRAADDAAGLSISEKMRKQIRGLTQASANAEDGISAVQTAEGALGEVEDMLQRMNELAVKASNGTNSESDRKSIQDEISQLTTEIDRVAETTKFNETYLLKGDSTKSKVATFTYDNVATSTAATITSAAGSNIIEDKQTGLKLTFSFNDSANVTDQNEIAKSMKNQGISFSYNATITQGTSSQSSFSLSLNGDAAQNYSITGAGTGAANEVYHITNASGTTIASITLTTGITTAATVAGDDKNYSGTISASGATAAHRQGDVMEYYDKDGNAISENALSNYFTFDGTTETAVAGMAVYDALGNRATLDTADVIGKQDVTGALSVDLHVGADSTKNNKITLNIDSMSAKGLGVNGLKVDGANSKNADAAVNTIAEAIKKVSAQRSTLGAVQNRLEHTIKNLDNIVENTTAAESAIRDTDMASEMVTFSKNNILAQAGQSMLAQANQSNQGVLSLLG